MNDEARRLVTALHEVKALRYGDFTLSSGVKSTYYVDVKTLTLHGVHLRSVCTALWRTVKSHFGHAGAVAGIESGSLHLLGGVLFLAGCEATGYLVRKQAKAHGTGQLVECPSGPVRRCVILEDVVTSGQSSLHAANKLWQAGVEVVGVVTVVDREQGGAETLARHHLPLHSLVTAADISAYRQEMTP